MTVAEIYDLVDSQPIGTILVNRGTPGFWVKVTPASWQYHRNRSEGTVRIEALVGYISPSYQVWSLS